LEFDSDKNILWCSMSCETDSSTFNEEGNTCDCDPGYATLSLVGYEHQWEAKCDPDTTE
jgi:hypothetical protein